MIQTGIGFMAYPVLIASIIDNARRKGFVVESLGKVGTGDDVYALVPVNIDEAKPNVLIAAGFHGDEAGGVYGLAKFLEVAMRDTMERVNLTILPAVNPAGLKLCQRNDYTNADPNRGYCHHEHQTAVGEVGEILIRNAQRLSESARHGFFTLHEDYTLTETFYVISEDSTNNSTQTLSRIMSAGERHFNKQPDGLHHEHFITEGSGSWFCDSSFEDMLSHDGVNRLYVLETPGSGTLKKRTSAIVDILTTFITEVADNVYDASTKVI